jgi:hypothetical protein
LQKEILIRSGCGNTFASEINLWAASTNGLDLHGMKIKD